ncbi:mitochondrial 39-S ribosomal protein L47 (MRP-L47)-domain-containing protein [Lactarius sanguifluus]|nr:mitochondrial 39-S ribosomal protein L47 (MRP-L47)-domain-containing protein [Lactarius sanguifluus]
MLSSLRSYTLNTARLLRHARRYSTPIDAAPKIGETSGAPGALRPHLNVPVNPNHGLYAFFRKREKDGEMTHDTLEDHSGMQDVFGRAWSAAELRRKSFRDLHTLWYVLVRERNLIATQMEGYRRASISPGVVRNVHKRDYQCRKSMARIKYVINERRLAYEGAIKIHAEKLEQAQKAKKAVHADASSQEREVPKVPPPVSETAQAVVDSLLQRSTA